MTRGAVPLWSMRRDQHLQFRPFRDFFSSVRDAKPILPDPLGSRIHTTLPVGRSHPHPLSYRATDEAVRSPTNRRRATQVKSAATLQRFRARASGRLGSARLILRHVRKDARLPDQRTQVA